MREIADALGAVAIVLSVEGDEEGEILRMACTGLAEAVVRNLHAQRLFTHGESEHTEHRWQRTIVDRTAIEIMTLPVKRMIGHRLMVISALFIDLNNEGRVTAERAYLARRPFAVGYFRLWQLDRVRQRREKALESALSSVRIGFVLIDFDGGIVFANSAALEFFAAGDGLTMQASRIHATNLKDGVRLRVALDHVITGTASNAILVSLGREAKPPLVLIAVPLECDKLENDAVAAVLHIIDPAADLTEILKPLCQSYNLLPSEAKLAIILASGLSLSESSQALNIKEQTARGMLKQIFHKTGVGRQSSLTSLLLLSLPTTFNVVSLSI